MTPGIRPYAWSYNYGYLLENTPQFKFGNTAVPSHIYGSRVPGDLPARGSQPGHIEFGIGNCAAFGKVSTEIAFGKIAHGRIRVYIPKGSKMSAHLILGKFTYYHYKPSYIFLGSSGFSDSLNIYLNPRESC